MTYSRLPKRPRRQKKRMREPTRKGPLRMLSRTPAIKRWIKSLCRSPRRKKILRQSQNKAPLHQRIRKRTTYQSKSRIPKSQRVRRPQITNRRYRRVPLIQKKALSWLEATKSNLRIRRSRSRANHRERRRRRGQHRVRSQ